MNNAIVSVMLIGVTSFGMYLAGSPPPSLAWLHGSVHTVQLSNLNFNFDEDAQSWHNCTKGANVMEWSEVVKKAMAYDLLQIIESQPQQETYTAEEIKKIIKVYVSTANQD